MDFNSALALLTEAVIGKNTIVKEFAFIRKKFGISGSVYAEPRANAMAYKFPFKFKKNADKDAFEKEMAEFIARYSGVKYKIFTNKKVTSVGGPYGNPGEKNTRRALYSDFIQLLIPKKYFGDKKMESVEDEEVMTEGESVKKMHFTFNKKVPSNDELWDWIDDQMFVTIEHFKVTGKNITVNVAFGGQGYSEKAIRNFTDMFSSKFNAATGKTPIAEAEKNGEYVGVSKIFFTRSKPFPSNDSIWKYIEKGEDCTVEGFTLSNGRKTITVSLHGPHPKRNVLDFIEAFEDEFDAANSKTSPVRSDD